MKCPKCGFLSSNDLDRCKRCGADWASVRARLEMRIRGRSKRVPDSVTPESLPTESPNLEETKSTPEPAVEHAGEASVLKGSIELEFDRLYETLKTQEEKTDEVRWGGFFRRWAAFSIDIAVLTLLSILLFYLIYVGTRVGLMAHVRIVRLEHLLFFLRVFVLSWVFLVGGYFVLLPGMSGMTVGKWVFGLRIVAANRSPISYSQAVLRWLGYAVSFPLGLGFLWILFGKEKRGWHDLMARTWVVRG